MATLTVRQSGGDYSSLSGACAAAIDDDVIAIQEAWTVKDTTAATVDDNITIQTEGASRSSDGEWDTGAYILSVATDLLTINASNTVTIVGLQFELNPGDTWAWEWCINATAASITLDLHRCIFRLEEQSSGERSGGIAMNGSNAGGTVKINDCAFDVLGSSGISEGIYEAQTSGTLYVYNCTFTDADTAIDSDDAGMDVQVRNCGFSNCTTGIDGTGVTEQTNSSTTPTFEGSTNHHLASGDTTWKDQGTDLSADSGRIDSADIDGDTRSGSWDIGCDEVAAAADPFYPELHSTLRRRRDVRLGL